MSTPHVSFPKCFSYNSVREPLPPGSTSPFPAGFSACSGLPSTWPLPPHGSPPCAQGQVHTAASFLLHLLLVPSP